MPLSALDLAATTEIRLPKGDTDPTVFTVGTLDGFTFTRLVRNLRDALEEKDATKAQECYADFLRRDLVSAKNYRLNGSDLKLVFRKEREGHREYEVVSDESLRHFPPGHIVDVALGIIEFNSLSEEEEKN